MQRIASMNRNSTFLMSSKRSAGINGYVLLLTMAALCCVQAENKIPEEYKVGGFFIGSQAYTFKNFTLFEAIEKTAQSGGRVIELSTVQKLSKDEPVVFDHNASAETLEKAKAKIAE